MLQEVTIKNVNRQRAFGFGWSTIPSGDSIEEPEHPDYVGTIRQVFQARADDPAWRAYGSPRATSRSACLWFLNGKPIVEIWRYGYLVRVEDLPIGDEEDYQHWVSRNYDHHLYNDVTGEGWFDFREADLENITGTARFRVSSTR